MKRLLLLLFIDKAKAMPKINIPTTLYAVTDHHVILTLTVKVVMPRGEFIQAETELAPGSDTDYGQCHHESYFEKLYFNLDGTLHMKHSTVFTQFDAAKQYAIKNAQDEIEREESHIARLKSKLTLLEAS